MPAEAPAHHPVVDSAHAIQDGLVAQAVPAAKLVHAAMQVIPTPPVVGATVSRA